MGAGARGYLPSNEWQIVHYPGTYFLLGRPSDSCLPHWFSYWYSRKGWGDTGEAPLEGAVPEHVFKDDPR